MHLFCLTPSCGTSFSVRPHVQTLKVPQVTVSPSGQAVKTQHKLIKQTRGQSAEGDRGCRRGGWRGRREAGGEEGAFPITPSHPAPHGSRAAGDTDPLHTALWCLQTQARQVPRESAAAGPHGAPTAPPRRPSVSHEQGHHTSAQWEVWCELMEFSQVCHPCFTPVLSCWYELHVRYNKVLDLAR